MLNMGPGELFVIFLVALIVLGPNKLPEAARQMGKVVAELRRLSGGFQDEVRAAMREPMPTLPPLPDEAHVPAPADDESAPEPLQPPRSRRRSAPLRADDASMPAEQQLSD